MKTLITLKNLIYIPILFVGLPIENYSILFYLMVFDIITGLIASYVIRGKHSLKSHVFTVGILSKLLIMLIPLVIALVAKGIDIDIVWFASHALSLFILSEGYSIIGNIISIRQRKYIAEFDAISWVLNFLRKGLLKFMGVNKKDYENQ